MIAAAVVRNAVALNLAVSVIHAVIHAVTNVAVITADMDMVTDMDMAMASVMDLDLVDVLGSGLFLSYSSAVADGASAEDLEEDTEDTVIQVSSNI